MSGPEASVRESGELERRGVGQDAAAFVVLTLVWGTTWAAIRIGLEDIPPLAGVSVRFLLAGSLLALVARWRGVPLGRSRRERWLWLYNGVLTFTVPYGVIYWAEQSVPTGLASILFATFPLWAALVGWWVLPGERPGPARIAGVALGFAGVAVIFSEDLGALAGGEIRGRALALLAAAGVSATGSIAVRRWGSDLPALSIGAVPMLLTGLLAGLGALAFESVSTIRLAPRSVLATLYLALFGTALTFTLYFRLLARRSVTAASLVSYTAPMIAVTVGVLLFREPLTLRLGLGAALVLAGVAGALTGRGRIMPQRDNSAAVR